MDYPFTTWTDYYEALALSLSTDYFRDVYPLYSRLIDNQGGDADVEIVRGLLKAGRSPQEGLDGLIKAILRGYRHCEDFEDTLREMLELIMKYPVEIHQDEILNMGVSFRALEKDIYDYNARGLLIDILSEYGLDVGGYANWRALTPAAYADIPNPDSFDPFLTRLQILKWYSRHLQSF
jgi:hypothetical protein